MYSADKAWLSTAHSCCKSCLSSENFIGPCFWFHSNHIIWKISFFFLSFILMHAIPEMASCSSDLYFPELENPKEKGYWPLIPVKILRLNFLGFSASSGHTGVSYSSQRSWAQRWVGPVHAGMGMVRNCTKYLLRWRRNYSSKKKYDIVTRNKRK